MGNLKIQERQIEGVTVLDIDGNIRIDGSSVVFSRAITDLAAKGRSQVVLNLARVAYIDSSGLGEIISSQVALNNRGGGMKLLNLTKRLLEIFTITKLVTVFDIYDDEMKAVDSFRISEAVAVHTTEPLQTVSAQVAGS